MNVLCVYGCTYINMHRNKALQNVGLVDIFIQQFYFRSSHYHVQGGSRNESQKGATSIGHNKFQYPIATNYFETFLFANRLCGAVVTVEAGDLVIHVSPVQFPVWYVGVGPLDEIMHINRLCRSRCGTKKNPHC